MDDNGWAMRANLHVHMAGKGTAVRHALDGDTERVSQWKVSGCPNVWEAHAATSSSARDTFSHALSR